MAIKPRRRTIDNVKSKTLFIAGAGASCEAKLPSGAVLKNKVGEKLNFKLKKLMDDDGKIDLKFGGPSLVEGDDDVFRALKKHSCNDDELNKYLDAGTRYFRARHQAISIDNYLDAHQSDKYAILCGKLGIAKTILESEQKGLLYYDETNRERMNFESLENTWYGAFQQILMENVEKSKLHKPFERVSFITFNYDRCIEHFLVNAVSNYYSVPLHDVYPIVKQTVIRHPYGVVGLLPWQDSAQDIQPVSFGQIQNVDLLQIAGQLYTFTEQQENNQKLAAIRQTVQEAEIVVFLGFGFHLLNMELLSPGGSCSAKKIYLTYDGISASDLLIVRDSIRKAIPGASEENPLGAPCAVFFKHFWRSLAS